MSERDDSHFQRITTLQRPLEIVRDHFYSGANDKRWWQHQKAIFAALTWPARWLVDRKMDLDGDTYERLLIEILRDIYKATKGRTEAIDYFPAYLITSVQSRWEEFYERSKRLSSSIDRALLAFRPIPMAAQDPAVKALAAANELVEGALAKGGRRAKRAPSDGSDQLSLFKR